MRFISCKIDSGNLRKGENMSGPTKFGKFLRVVGLILLGLTAIFHLSSNLSKIFLFKKGLDKKLLLTIGIPSVIFVIVGGVLSKVIKSEFLEVVLGLFLVGFSLLFLIKTKVIVPPNSKNAIVGGAFSGFSAGLLGTGGAIRGLTMAAFNLEKSVFIATSAFIDFMIDFFANLCVL